MTAIPAGAYFSNPARTNQQAKTAQDAMLAVLRELPGGGAETTLTIAAGVVTPTGAVHAIDTEGAAASDELTNVLTTNHPEGRLLVVSPASDARDVVVKHAAGGAGQILLADGADLTLSDGTMHLVLKRVGADWKEVARFYGKEAAAARAFLGAAGTGAANTFTQNQTVDRAGASAVLAVGSDRSSGVVAQLQLFGHDSGGANTTFAAVEAEVTDATDGAEFSRINFRNYRNGGSGVGMRLANGLIMAGVTDDKGTGTIHALEFYRNGAVLIKAGTPLVLNPYTVNTTVTQTHGLGVEPMLARVVLECLSAEHGYSVGDKILLSPGDGAENNNTATFSLLPDATNLTLVTHQNGLPNIVHKTGRNNVAITAAKWKLTVTPIAIG